jgi:hypothetical protein
METQNRFFEIYSYLGRSFYDSNIVSFYKKMAGMVMYKYKLDAVITTIIQTREQLEKLKEIFPTLVEISVDVSDEEEKLILKELEMLEKIVKSISYGNENDKNN